MKKCLIISKRCVIIDVLFINCMIFADTADNILGFEVNKMKEGIPPAYYQATVTCNCGNTFVTGSTKEDIHVEICSKCHSFYTGQQKGARTDGRIDKFNKKYGVK